MIFNYSKLYSNTFRQKKNRITTKLILQEKFILSHYKIQRNFYSF